MKLAAVSLSSATLWHYCKTLLCCSLLKHVVSFWFYYLCQLRSAGGKVDAWGHEQVKMLEWSFIKGCQWMRKSEMERDVRMYGVHINTPNCVWFTFLVLQKHMYQYFECSSWIDFYNQTVFKRFAAGETSYVTKFSCEFHLYTFLQKIILTPSLFIFGLELEVDSGSDF